MTNTDSVLWTFLNASGHRIECVVRFAPGGVQVEILSDGSPLISRVFPNGTEAMAWAEEERGTLAQSLPSFCDGEPDASRGH